MKEKDSLIGNDKDKPTLIPINGLPEVLSTASTGIGPPQLMPAPISMSCAKPFPCKKRKTKNIGISFFNETNQTYMAKSTET